jgi:hypothetical protein
MMKRRIVFSVLAVMLLVPALPAQAQAGERCFRETGFCISGAIRTYWERNGGLPVFGYPIAPLSDQLIGDWVGPAQWFERDRLEDHANQGLGVLAGRLGAQLLEMQQRPWEGTPRENGGQTGCLFFRETGRNLCGDFLRYWQRNGGLARFGYPISGETYEQIGDWSGTVQYFERRRMELHGELRGSPVLLGLLGRIVSDVPGRCFEAGPPLTATAWAYRGTFGCASPYPLLRSIAYQPFQNGAMLWMTGLGSRLGNGIVIITRDPSTGATTWQIVNDTWAPGQPESGGETPPAGLYEPVRGFGKLWRGFPHIRAALGWGTAPEAADAGVFYNFERGHMLLRQGADRVHLLYYDGSRADEITRLSR